MPRKADGEAEAQRLRMIKYREGLEERREPETDAVDTALAQALSAYLHALMEEGSADGHRVNTALLGLARRSLVSSGYSADASQRRVENRAYYLAMAARYPAATAQQRKLWLVGPPSDPEAADLMDVILDDPERDTGVDLADDGGDDDGHF